MLSKSAVHSTCKQLLEERLTLVREEMLALQASAGEETKSSAGDKYETTREMIQGEKAKVASQLEETTRFIHLLSSVDVSETCASVKTGCLALVDTGWLYLTISLGVVKVDGLNVFVVSPVSPIAQTMLGKKVGDQFSLNGKVQTIKQLL
jgi:transcription elongation GreA/GreB family factor